MSILTFFQEKSGRATAARSQPKDLQTVEVTTAADEPSICPTDEVSIELARAREDNSSAAQRLEGMLFNFLDTNQRLRNEVHWFNAPLT